LGNLVERIARQSGGKETELHMHLRDLTSTQAFSRALRSIASHSCSS
jgi:hypothetical protein